MSSWSSSSTTDADVREAEIARLQVRLERERQARRDAERISEESTRALYDRQRELRLLLDIGQAVNSASDLGTALGAAISRICAYTGWPVGHVYLADPADRLRSATIWHLADPERFAAFREITERTSFSAGEGLPGRVLASGEPLWLPDVTIDPNFPRARENGDIGVRGGCGFPILVGEEVVGVMEFFSDLAQPANQRQLELMGQIGTELGRAIERERAQTAERNLNSELAARAGELERSNAELAQFASIASHDLQEPLRKVRTFTQRVVDTETDGLSEPGQDYLRRANSAAGRMQKLIDDLLAFSRVTSRPRTPIQVDLGTLTAEVMADLEATIERAQATVSVGTLPTIEADAPQMRQLVQNLLANALKFRREGAACEVGLHSRVRDGTAEITVRDNGIGFDPQYREQIFDVFERLHGRSEYDGTGIGLALCRKIVERHGGTIEADAALGVGATFTIVLPLSAGADV